LKLYNCQLLHYRLLITFPCCRLSMTERFLEVDNRSLIYSFFELLVWTVSKNYTKNIYRKRFMVLQLFVNSGDFILS